MKTEIWAHRGASRDVPENTMAAFEKACADGADGLEIDVQRTKDGELVVFHDEQLERLTGDPRQLKDLTRRNCMRFAWRARMTSRSFQMCWPFAKNVSCA